MLLLAGRLALVLLLQVTWEDDLVLCRAGNPIAEQCAAADNDFVCPDPQPTLTSFHSALSAAMAFECAADRPPSSRASLTLCARLLFHHFSLCMLMAWRC